MSKRLHLAAVIAGLVVSACGGGSDATAADTPASAAPGGSPGGIVIRATDGGKHPDRFCIPQWSIANRSGTDVGALLVELEWRTRGGEVLEPVGEFGHMVEPLRAGSEKDRTLNGYTAACADLVLRVGRYACRDDNAVRMPCPAAIRAEAPGGVSIDLSGAAEGPMRGAVEAPQ